MKRKEFLHCRRVLARVSRETKGPPGVHMEASGLWDKPGLTA